MSSDLDIGYGSAPNTAPVGSYGHTGGSIIGSGGGSLNSFGSFNPQGLHITGSFSSILPQNSFQIFTAGLQILNTIGKIVNMRTQSSQEQLNSDIEQFQDDQKSRIRELKELDDKIKSYDDDVVNTRRVMYQNSYVGAEVIYAVAENFYDLPYVYNPALQVDTINRNQFAI